MASLANLAMRSWIPSNHSFSKAQIWLNHTRELNREHIICGCTSIIMKIFLTTFYFDHIILKKRDYITLEICIQIIEYPLFSENQKDGRVVTLVDGLTVHNAFFDRNFNLEKRGLG